MLFFKFTEKDQKLRTIKPKENEINREGLFAIINFFVFVTFDFYVINRRYLEGFNFIIFKY
jgi:hypothetical protein